MSSFEFDAPQFVNFLDIDDAKANKFFDLNEHQDVNVEYPIVDSTKKICKTPAHELHDSENQVLSSTVNNKNLFSSKKNFTVFREVLHEIVNHQIQSNIPSSQFKEKEKDITEQFESLHLNRPEQQKSKGPIKATKVFSGITFQESARKPHSMMTRLDAVNQKISKHSNYSEDSSEQAVSSTTPNLLRNASVKRKASPINSSRKFISLAEQVEHFYKDTPDRYRSKPSKMTTPDRETWVAKSNYMPKTPNLVTKYRQRKVNFPDAKQREEMELEEIKRNQIKAHPLNEKILIGPCLNLKVPITKKPVTVPQPFSLTEVKKKELPPDPVFHFKAQPVPTVILKGPVGIPPKKAVMPTIPTTPQIKMPSRLRVEVKSQERNTSSESLSLPRNTKIEPFSFDGRMRDLLQKKEEFVKKVIEEEKKSFNSFKAHPMPDFKSINENTPKIEKRHHKTVPQPFSLTQPKGNKSFLEESNELRITPFKAKPASVVHQKPFVPKLAKHEFQPPSDFQLNTEKRAAERQKFDEKIKQKEEELAIILKLQKEEEEKMEKERMLEERKKTEFKATPMPRYKVFEIHGSDPDSLTLPQSPMFSDKAKKKTSK